MMNEAEAGRVNCHYSSYVIHGNERQDEDKNMPVLFLYER